MTIRFKRESNIKGVVCDTTDYDSCIVFICANVTSDEHYDVKQALEESFNHTCKCDLYFTRNMVSIFIFDEETLDSTSYNSDYIKTLIPDIKHNVIYHGSIYGRRINDLLVTHTREEIRIGKKWKEFLTIRRA